MKLAHHLVFAAAVVVAVGAVLAAVTPGATGLIAGEAKGEGKRRMEEAGFQWSIARLVSGRVRSLESERQAIVDELVALPVTTGRQESAALGFHAPILASFTEEYWVQVDLGAEQTIDTIVLVPVRMDTGVFSALGYGFPVRFRVEVSTALDFAAVELVADHSAEDFRNPGEYPVLIPAGGRRARYVRLTVARHFARRENWVFALGELMVLAGNRNVAIGGAVTASRLPPDNAQWAARFLVDGQGRLGLPVMREESASNGFHSRHERSPDQAKWVQVDLGQRVQLQEIRLIPARPTDYQDVPGLGFPVRFKIESSDEPDFEHPRILVDVTDKDFANPGDNEVVLPLRNAEGRFVRVTATKLWQTSADWVFALAELQVYANDRNVALGAPVTAKDSFENPRFPKWKRDFLVDGFSSQHRLIELPEWLRGLDRRRQLEERLRTIDLEIRLAADIALVRGAQGVGVGLAALASGIGALLWRQRRSRMREVEQVRARIASDLHDDIGSNLGSITLAAQVAARRAAGQESARGYEEIERIARTTSEAMHDIVWLLKPEHGNLEELLVRMKSVAVLMLAGREHAFEVVGEISTRPLSLEFTRHVYLFFKETLNNVVKHAEAGVVDIRIDTRGGRFRLSVRDQGVGFDETRPPPGDGLSNLRSRAESLGGKFHLISRCGQGTTVALEVELKQARATPPRAQPTALPPHS